MNFIQAYKQMEKGEKVIHPDFSIGEYLITKAGQCWKMSGCSSQSFAAPAIPRLSKGWKVKINLLKSR